MEGTPQTLTERRSAWMAAVSCLTGSAGVLHQAQGAELAGLVSVLDELSAQAAAVRALVVAEAVRRGEVDSTLVGWVREHAPSLQQGGAQQLASVVTHATKGGPIWSAGSPGVNPDSPVGIVWDAVTGADGGRASRSDEASHGDDAQGENNGAAVGVGQSGDADPADADGHVGEGDDASPNAGAPDANSRGSDPGGVFADVSVITTCTSPITPALGLAVLNEVRALTPRLQPEVVPTVTKALVDLGRGWGAGHMRKFRAALLAEYGQPGELHEVQDKLAKAAYLSAPHVEETGLTAYRMTLTPEQACTLEAAIGPLSAPAPNPDTGEKDQRPAGQRRVEALTTIIRRAQAAMSAGAGKEGAAGAWAAVHVTIPLDDLRAATGCTPTSGPFGNVLSTPNVSESPTAGGPVMSGDAPQAVHQSRAAGAGQVLLSRAEGVLLSPEMLRRIACDADLIPVVLGTRGEIVDQGQPARLATPAIRRRLLLRDRHCTYPGCEQPGGWCRAHHVIHWLDQHRTDPDTLALLCERHHTLVHDLRLWADVLPHPDQAGRTVVWDVAPGSYDHALARLRDTGEVPERDHLTDPVIWTQEWGHDPDGPPAIWDDNAGTYISFPTHEPRYPIAG